MQTKLKKLIRHYGTREAVQQHLDIKNRTMSGILNSKKENPYPCGKPLKILIDRLLNDIKIRDLIK